MNEFHELFIHHTTDVIIQWVAYRRVVFDYCIMNWFKNDLYFLRNITHQTHYIISLTKKLKTRVHDERIFHSSFRHEAFKSHLFVSVASIARFLSAYR